MRVAVVTESFLPLVNGVTRSVQRVCEQLVPRGHEVVVVAPAAAGGAGPLSWAGAPVLRAPAVPLPGYPEVRVALPGVGLRRVLARLEPDVVHLAGPLVLGAQGAAAARRLGLPTVAVYQTDLPAYAARYGFGQPGERLVREWLRRVHGAADLTLAPSRAAARDLEQAGVDRVRLWPRGVDLTAFSPRHRDPAVRRALAPRGELLVGYVGRLAAEKELALLQQVDRLLGVRLVVVGDGPERSAVRRALPAAHHLGFRAGPELSRVVAALDAFVHPGRTETFCQAAQEALASGVPLVAVAAGGLLDLVDHGRTGLLVPAGDGGALAGAVALLRDDRVLLGRLRRAARPSVAGRSWERVADALLVHYADAGARVGAGREEAA